MIKSEPALICVSLRFGSIYRGRALPVYAVYVDGRAVESSPYASVSAIVVPEGMHTVQVRIHPYASDIVELDLRGGDQVNLVCDMQPVFRSRFWRAFEIKFFWFVSPLALLAFYLPQ